MPAVTGAGTDAVLDDILDFVIDADRSVFDRSNHMRHELLAGGPKEVADAAEEARSAGRGPDVRGGEITGSLETAQLQTAGDPDVRHRYIAANAGTRDLLDAHMPGPEDVKAPGRGLIPAG